MNKYRTFSYHKNKSVFEEYFNLELSDKSYELISCPLHKDINPSLSVSVEKGLFCCFSCGWSGSSVKLAQAVRRTATDLGKGSIKMELKCWL